jgi:ribokinase
VGKPPIISVGSINADFQMRVAEEDRQAMALASGFERLGGGKAANVAVVARKLGSPASVLGVVGKDDLAEQALSPLDSLGIDLSGVGRTRDAPTGVSMITVPPSGKKSILLAENANACWSEDDLKRLDQRIRSADASAVVSVDYEIPAEVAGRALAAAASRGLRTVIDPSFAQRVEASSLGGVTAITPNHEEAEILTGKAAGDLGGAIEAASVLRERGVAIVTAKLADGGTLLSFEGETWHLPPLDVEVEDTTGAGDAFCGTLAVYLDEGPLEAACLATAAASFAVTAFGSQTAYRDEAAVHEGAKTVRSQAERVEAS